MPLESDALYECPVCCRPLVFTIVVDRDGDGIVESVEAE